MSVIKTKTSTKKKTVSLTVNYKNFSYWIMGFVFVIIFIAFFTGNKTVFDMYTLKKERDNLAARKAVLTQYNQNLENEIASLKNDLDFIETVAREEFNLKRDDETIFTVLPKDFKNR